MLKGRLRSGTWVTSWYRVGCHVLAVVLLYKIQYAGQTIENENENDLWILTIFKFVILYWWMISSEHIEAVVKLQKSEEYLKKERRGTWNKCRQMKQKQTQWQGNSKKKKSNYKQHVNKYKRHSTIIFLGDMGGWTEGGRLIGKCFLRVMRAEQSLQEVMGMNWWRAGREFWVEGMAQAMCGE